jgi:hypothetical protein
MIISFQLSDHLFITHFIQGCVVRLPIGCFGITVSEIPPEMTSQELENNFWSNEHSSSIPHDEHDLPSIKSCCNDTTCL